MNKMSNCNETFLCLVWLFLLTRDVQLHAMLQKEFILVPTDELLSQQYRPANKIATETFFRFFCTLFKTNNRLHRELASPTFFGKKKKKKIKLQNKDP